MALAQAPVAHGVGGVIGAARVEVFHVTRFTAEI
jgi:hypothetical protein